MKRTIVGVLGSALLFGCSTATPEINRQANCVQDPTNALCNAPLPPIVNESANVEESAPTLVGGWVPTFYTWFDTKQLDQTVEGLNDGRIKRVVISYPSKMQSLATKIHNYLQIDNKQNIKMESLELKDTDQVSYNLTQVVVTLYFR